MHGGIITQVIFGKAYDEEDVQKLKDILRKVAPTANVVVIDKNKEE
jgi:sulfur carrier protein ThiS